MKRIAVAAALALLAGCGAAPSTPPGTTSASVSPVPSSPSAGSPSEPGITTAPPATSAPSGTGASTQPSDLPPPTSTGPVQRKHAPAEPPIVTAIRTARHQQYDRVVIDLKGAMTGYSADWVTQLVQDGSGEPIEIKGGAFLLVSLSPANAHTTDGKPTLDRTPVLLDGLTNVSSVVRTGDFEGVVSVALVLRHRAGFRVIEQSNPSRLVVDVAH